MQLLKWVLLCRWILNVGFMVKVCHILKKEHPTKTDAFRWRICLEDIMDEKDAEVLVWV